MYKALVIDDDKLNLRLMTAMLTQVGYEVFACERGDHGIEMALEIQPDVIMLDLLMPKPTYDGEEVVRLLREMPEFQDASIVAVSAADAQTIQKLVNSGLFTDFLQKPITRDALNVVLDRLNHRNTA